jgi:Effector-associated domain 1
MDYLENSLARLYKSPDDATRILLHCGLDPAAIDLSGGARMMWFRALAEAKTHEKITAILERASEEYPGQRAALFEALPEFEKRLKRGGGPARGSTQPLMVFGAVSIVAVCFLAFLAFLPKKEDRPIPDVDPLWKSIEKLENRSFSITKEIGALENGKEEIKGQLQEKTAQIEDLKKVTASLEHDLAALRKRPIETLTADQKERLTRAEGAVALGGGYIHSAQGDFSKAQSSFEEARKKLESQGPATKDNEPSTPSTSSIAMVQTHLNENISKLNDLNKKVPGDKVVISNPPPQPISEKRADPVPTEHRDAVTFEPSTIPSLKIETFEMAGEVESLLLLKPGESLGKSLENVGKISLVDPGKYNVVCNTTTNEQWDLIRDIEIRPGQRTIVRPQSLIGKAQIDELTRAGFPRFELAQLVPAGQIDSGMIHGRPRKTKEWGATFPIVAGKYDVLVTPYSGKPFVLVKNLEVVAGGKTVVRTNEEIAAIVVRPETTKDLEFEGFLVCKFGSNVYIQDATAAGQPMLVYAGDQYDVFLKQSNAETALKKQVTPLRGALTFVP